jgi:hypothetical protein
MAVYSVPIQYEIYVLHAVQKKSRTGIATDDAFSGAGNIHGRVGSEMVNNGAGTFSIGRLLEFLTRLGLGVFRFRMHPENVAEKTEATGVQDSRAQE